MKVKRGFFSVFINFLTVVSVGSTGIIVLELLIEKVYTDFINID